ncbi:hypothetical protein D3C87_1580600 [compost metagenome]
MGGVHQQNPWTGERAHAIDVAVGHVASHIVRIPGQPDRFLHPQQTREDFLYLRLAHARIAIGVEQYRFGGDQRAFAVDMDGPAFIAQRRTKALHAQVIESAASQAFIQIVS